MRKSLLFVWACMGLVCLMSACKTSVKSKEWKLVWVEDFDQKNSFDESALVKIAKMTDGLYFRATSKNELANIYKTIDSLEKTKIEDYKFTQKKEEFAPFVLLALLLFGIEFALSQTICKRFP